MLQILIYPLISSNFSYVQYYTVIGTNIGNIVRK